MEITASQYAERRGVNNANDYRRAYHRIDAAAHNDGSEEKRDFRDRGSHGNNGDAQKILDKLSEKNYDMTPEEVYQASIETVEETM